MKRRGVNAVGGAATRGQGRRKDAEVVRLTDGCDGRDECSVVEEVEVDEVECRG
jgi:hypothetical protein